MWYAKIYIYICIGAIKRARRAKPPQKHSKPLKKHTELYIIILINKKKFL
jgi:hypothetical protein